MSLRVGPNSQCSTNGDLATWLRDRVAYVTEAGYSAIIRSKLSRIDRRLDVLRTQFLGADSGQSVQLIELKFNALAVTRARWERRLPASRNCHTPCAD